MQRPLLEGDLRMGASFSKRSDEWRWLVTLEWALAIVFGAVAVWVLGGP